MVQQAPKRHDSKLIQIQSEEADDALFVPRADFAGVFVSLDRFAKFTGRSKACLALWRRQGKGPHAAKIGGRIFYDQSSVARWILQHKIRPAA